MHKLQKGDKVQVISGKYKGDVSTVEAVSWDLIIVKGVNKVKKAVKGQWFVEKHKPVHISTVMYYCEKCKAPVRVGIDVDKNNKKVRVCKKCNTNIAHHKIAKKDIKKEPKS